MRLATRPILSRDGSPVIELTVGIETVEMSPMQAEDIAMSILRAVTASRYEAGTMAVLRENDNAKKVAVKIIDQIRVKVNARGHARS